MSHQRSLFRLITYAAGFALAAAACGKSAPPTKPDNLRRYDRGTSMAVITDVPCPSDPAKVLRQTRGTDGIDVYILRAKGQKRCKIVKTTRQGQGPHPEVRRFVEEDRHGQD